MSKFNLVRLMWYRNKVKWKYRTVSGTPPLTYKAKSDEVLKNYRIYGNTVNGESVGDKTENLIQGVITGVNINSNGKISGLSDYNVVYAPVVAEESYTISNNNGTNVYAFYAEVPTTETPASYNGSRQVFNSDSMTFTAPITGYAAVRTASTAQDIMINFGSEALPYEPYGYKVPVTVSNGTDTLTTPIYLPESIKMVGSEAEYIDYAEQKQHRVRKNLFDEKYEGIDDEYDLSNTIIYKSINVGAGVFTLSTNTPKTSEDYCNIFFAPGIVDSGVTSLINGVSVGNSKKFTSIDGYITIGYRYYHGVNPKLYQTQLERGNTATDYEPYIENTDLDVILPALPTLTGTNVLSVGTAVQPSGVELRGRIMEVDSGGD